MKAKDRISKEFFRPSHIMSDSAKITVNYFCLGAFFIFIGSVLLCALGFTVVLPFEVTRSWPAVVCTVVNSSFDPNVCSCDEQLSVFDTCVSKYPCLQIHVLYVPQQRGKSTAGAGGGTSTVNGTEASMTSKRKVERNLLGLKRERRWAEEKESKRNAEFGDLKDGKWGFDGSVNSTPETTVGLPKTTTGNDVTGDFPRRTPPHRITSTASIFEETSSDFHANNIPLFRSSVKLTTTTTSAETSDERQSDDVTSSSQPSRSPTSLPSTAAASQSNVEAVGGSSEDGRKTTEALRSYSSSSSESSSATPPKNLTSKERFSRTERNQIQRTDGSSRSWPSAPVTAVLYRSWDDSFYRQCSLTECGDESWNVKEARRFKGDWGDPVGKTFTCFYNPFRPDVVIIERTSTVAAVHAVLWPGLCLLGGITLWIGLCLGCWSLGAESSFKDDNGPIY